MLCCNSVTFLFLFFCFFICFYLGPDKDNNLFFFLALFLSFLLSSFVPFCLTIYISHSHFSLPLLSPFTLNILHLHFSFFLFFSLFSFISSPSSAPFSISFLHFVSSFSLILLSVSFYVFSLCSSFPFPFISPSLFSWPPLPLSFPPNISLFVIFHHDNSFPLIGSRQSQ